MREICLLIRLGEWANYFKVGTVNKAYRAIDNYTAVRLRRCLRSKHKVRRLKGRDLSTLAPLWRRMREACLSGSMSGMLRRSHRRPTKASPDERGGKQICSSLKPLRHISTVPFSTGSLALAREPTSSLALSD